MKILGFGNRKHNEKVSQACYWRKNAIENARYNVCGKDSLRLIEVKVDVFKKETGFFCFVHDEWSVLLTYEEGGKISSKPCTIQQNWKIRRFKMKTVLQ